MVKKATRKVTKRRTVRAAPVRKDEDMASVVTGAVKLGSSAMIGVGVMSAIGGMFQPK